MAESVEGVRWTSSWLAVVTCVVLCWSGMAGQARAQTCTTVADSYVACEQSGNISVALSCPDKYIIKVLTLSYHVAATPGCPAPYTGDPPADHCLVSYDPPGVWTECNKKTACTKEVVKDTSGTCGGGGAHYIRIVHYCEPLHYLNLNKASVTSMESRAPLSALQLVYISSNTKALLENGVTFTDTSLGCTITVPDNTQIAFQILFMMKNPPQSGCNQKIQFWDGVSYARTICGASATDMTLGGCDVSGNTFYIKYLNSDPSVKVGFIISVGVSHHVPGFEMQCGLEVASLPDVVIPTTTTPAPTTQTPATANPELKVADAPPQGDQSLQLIIILISVAVFLVILIVIVALLIRKFSRKPTILEGSEPEDLTVNKPVYSYVRDVYLDGENSSQLVMDRGRSNTPSSGSMALRL